LDKNACNRCGKEMPGQDESYCPECRGDARRKNGKRLRYSAVAVILLSLTGWAFWYGDKNAWDFSWDALLGRPVAVINGEPVPWSEARERFKTTRVILEKQYGNDLFAGERGRAFLADLERDVLEKMTEERLVAQEARRMNIRVSDGRVMQEMRRIGDEIYGNWDNFQASLKEDGISQDYLMNHVRNLLLRQELTKAKVPPGVDPDQYFGAWLTRNRQMAKITFNQTAGVFRASPQGRGSCCGSGGGDGAVGGGGCGGKQAGPLDQELESKAGAAALAEYRKKNPAEKEVEAKVTDYGCHIQVDIEKGGKTIWSYSYQDGNVTDN
jgi:hypothetical protein